MEMFLFTKIKEALLPVRLDVEKVNMTEKRMEKAMRAVLDGDEEWFCGSRKKEKKNACDV